MASDPGHEDATPDAITDTEEITVRETGTQLERTIGLTGGLAIGIGTMIGAGIFVFPGLAAERVGVTGAISFLIGAIIALLVAVPTSELATAMPRSGGGYYFISRSLGTGLGAIVGLGLWIGLVFATAFYLVGLGYYAADVLSSLGVSLPTSPVIPLGLLSGLILTLLNITGTENTAKLQNYIVGLLLLILTFFLSVGGLDALGIIGSPSAPERYNWGVAPLFSTAALVFTSYLGFAQVATVAGDIKDPGRNLPLAMVGSVLVVGSLYILTMVVATSISGSAALAAAGETAMVEVGRELFGLPGAIAILLAGLLATVSSANASILSASRAVYATSRDALLPAFASRLNPRYNTPHIALVMSGGPVLALVATGQVELLAEVASFLHLVMYGLICVALVVLRRRDPDWYDPDFRMPGVPAIPIVGAIASFGLIAFMNLLSIILGGVIIVVCFLWSRYYAADVQLKNKL